MSSLLMRTLISGKFAIYFEKYWLILVLANLTGGLS